MLFLWPLLLAISVLIMLDSPGPALFTQKRVGARWRSRGLTGHWETTTFNCHKFRTMFHKCDQSMHEAFIKAFVTGKVETSEEHGLPYKLNGDPRVTRVGHWLRKSSLDELPQLLNILKGEMSLVGPRPVPLYEVAAYDEWHRERLKALPGLTGMWQVKGRSQVTFDQMAQLDIEYVRNQSILLDLKLLLATFPAVLAGKGAG
jgi:lipopolysaccharide/colanic/teichoic acid biosynthesis glycosyltransferase